MRKCTSVLLCVILVLSLCGTAFAAQENCMEARVEVDLEKNIAMVIVHAAQSVTNARISVAYDPEHLDYVGEAGPDDAVMSVKEEEGRLTVGLACPTDKTVPVGGFVLNVGLELIGDWDHTQVEVTAERWNGKAGENVTIDVERYRFRDVKPNQWFYEAVEAMAADGYIKGISQTHFGPGLNMNRASFVTLLGRMAGVAEEQVKTQFVDVPENSFYSGYVAWAAENKITNGSDATHFNPTGDINRAQMVTFLYRYAKYAGQDVAVENLDILKDYADGEAVAEITWAADAFAWAIENGIVNGMDGKLNPNGTANRAQVAVMLYRFFFGQ